MPGGEWGDIALTTTREQFTAVYRHPFLYSTQAPVKPRRPQRTDKFHLLDTTGAVPLTAPSEQGGEPFVLAVKKVQSAFPSMITVGRTQNNDVVVEDVQVSKFHAFFRIFGEVAEVGDAGSSNGTLVRGVRLEPRGATVRVASGDLVRLGSLEFVFLSSGACWHRIVTDLEEWGA